MSFYDYKAVDIDGQEIEMSQYKGKVVLVVNTASKCGLTPQFKELQDLYDLYNESGFEILGFPCNQFASQETGSSEEIIQFCQFNYGVTFTMFEKIDVNGASAHPLYQYLKTAKKSLLINEIKWNFEKFLIDKEGNVVKRFAPTTVPMKLKKDIEALLK
jgi:glutathione peroxidase